MPTKAPRHDPFPRNVRRHELPDTRMRGRKLQERNQRLRERNPLCVACQAEGIVRTVDEWDHIVPLSKGGTDDDLNLQGLCHDHHARKTARERAGDVGGGWEKAEA